MMKKNISVFVPLIQASLASSNDMQNDVLKTDALEKTASYSYKVSGSKNNFLNRLAKDLKLPVVSHQLPTEGFCLFMQDNILSLKNMSDQTQKTQNIICVDFLSGASTYRREQGGGKNQALGKAIGLNKKSGLCVLDATAGLGKDAFVLAGLGCTVTMVEQSPIVGALLRDALVRGMEDSEVEDIIERMTLVVSDSVNFMQSPKALNHPPDVVYLDPMYPERKKSAKVKKEMQTLQQLLGHQDDLDAMLDAAMGCAKSRVVVKRPKGSASLSARKPTHIVESKKTRYDVYMILNAFR